VRIALACLVLIFAACESRQEPVGLAVPGYAYPVKLGETLHMVDGFSIEFTTVVSESRCPRNLTCVWAGDAVIQLTARSGGKSSVLELHTAGNGNVARYEGWSIRLDELEPWPVTGGQTFAITSGEYTARLFVERNTS
jgi:hypothetical protein